MIKIKGLNKVYAGGFQALKDINLEITKGEIFALLGPNGAGKTTLISSICGLSMPTSGEILVDGKCTEKDYRHTRNIIGLVPQELTSDAFISVWDTVSFTRGLFGLAPNPKLIEKILKDLSLWDKKDNRLMELSGGMKRRVLIAKALSHEPKVLFLDEPTAGVDVDLRRDMWKQVRLLQESGVTIILTTHYIEEAQEMAHRVGVISNGEIILVEDKNTLMKKLGKKELKIELREKLDSIPTAIASRLTLSPDKLTLHYQYDSQQEDLGILQILTNLKENHINYKDIITKQSSLEEIFVELVRNKA